VTQSTSAIVREILSADQSLTADQVVAAVRKRGQSASDDYIRKLTYHIRSELKKAGTKAPTAAAPASTRPASTATQAPKPVPVAARETPAPKPAAPSDLPSVLANVALVNGVVGLCGGPDNARKVAEAVAACGGVEAFLLHLDLVAGIRAGG
jgi:hypothetical protein